MYSYTVCTHSTVILYIHTNVKRPFWTNSTFKTHFFRLGNTWFFNCNRFICTMTVRPKVTRQSLTRIFFFWFLKNEIRPFFGIELLKTYLIGRNVSLRKSQTVLKHSTLPDREWVWGIENCKFAKVWKIIVCDGNEFWKWVNGTSHATVPLKKYRKLVLVRSPPENPLVLSKKPKYWFEGFYSAKEGN